MELYSFYIIFILLVVLLVYYSIKKRQLISIANQKLINTVSVIYVVLDEDFGIVNYNELLLEEFQGLVSIYRNANIIDIFDNNPELHINSKIFERAVAISRKYRKTYSREVHISIDKLNKYFKVNITPLFSNESYLGTILIMEDITQNKYDIGYFKQMQKQMTEQERQTTFGQLIGGIAHNFKTPVMTVSGIARIIRELSYELEESINDVDVTVDDHNEIAGEIEVWADKIDQNCKYMLEILSSVKKQEINLDFKAEGTFSVREAIEKSLEIIGQEIVNRHCEIKTSIKVPDEIRIKGDVNGLVQILNNLIENASEAYERNGGIVEIRAVAEKSNVKISVIDYGTGISEELRNKLFKEMVTTKGKEGTGLGLYISFSTLKVMFHGDMWFETMQNKGTSFNISIPFINTYSKLH